MSASSPIAIDSEISSKPTDHFTVLETLNHGLKHFKCNYCEAEFKGTATRCFVHLTGMGSGVAACLAVPEAVVTKVRAAKAQKAAESSQTRQASEAAEQRKRDRRESAGSTGPSTSAAAAAAAAAASGGGGNQSQIARAFAPAHRSAADRALADLIFGEGLPMRLVTSPLLRPFIRTVQQVPGYKPPAYNTLRGTLLADAKRRTADSLLPWEERLKETMCTVCSDGWSDASNRPLLNIMAVNPKGVVFLTAVDTSGEAKSADYIAACIMEGIEQLGPDNVVQVVTDNAAACRAAGALIEAHYPHITWSPCVAHVCDLALEAIYGLNYFKEVHTSTKAYVTFINNHHHTLSAWRQHQAAGGGDVLQLLKPGETRFASALLMIERTIKVKSKLQQFVVSDGWNDAINTMKTADKAAAEGHKTTILSATHWAAAERAFSICEPILILLRHADSDVPTSGKIHYYAYKVQQRLEEVDGMADELMDDVKDIWQERWEYMRSPLHGAAYCLDPEFLTDTGLGLRNSRDLCVADLLKMIGKLVPTADAQAVRVSYAAFRAREGLFGGEAALSDASIMPAFQWWDMYGADHPQLRKLAITLLSQVTSACSCERNWSAYDFIHNRRRNRLTPARARDLVYVFTNGRLARKMAAPAGEQFIGWDEAQEEEMEGSSGDEGEAWH